MFQHNRNANLPREFDYQLTKEDVEAFKKNQAVSYRAHKQATKLEVAAKLKVGGK